MAISRRDALRLAGIGAASIAMPAGAEAAGLYSAGVRDGWPILQGPSDRNSASFVLLLPDRYPFTASVDDGAGRTYPLRIAAQFDVPGLPLATTELVASGLSPGRDYTLTITDGDGAAVDRRTFRSFDPVGSRYRFAVASCMFDRFPAQAVAMWEAVARESCDFVVFLGDTAYSDILNPGKSEAGYARRYAQTRLRLSWFRLERLVPSFAVWDDHDFGLNNGDRTFPRTAFMTQLFRAFWGSADNAISRKNFGVGSRLEMYGQRFYLLDDRSFRDPDSPTGRHWGRDQTDWLIDDIGRDARPAWLMNGSQFFGGYFGKDSVESDHPGDFRDVIHRLSRLAAPVTFASGDVHFSELMRIERAALGYETAEFTSSSIHSVPLPEGLAPNNPRRIASTPSHNFLVFDVDGSSEWRIRARAIVQGNGVAFDHAFTIRR